MSPATRKGGAWAVVPLALAAVLVPGGVWAGRVAWTTWADLVPQRNAIPPGRRVELGARAEDVNLVTGDGVALRGWYAPSRNGAAVVLVHGLGGDRTQLLRPAARLAGLGYGVLVFDLRGHGESGGRGTSLGGKERADVRAAVDFVASRSEVLAGRLAAVGYSIGGMALELEAAADRRVSAVVLAGSFPSLSAMVHLHEPGPRGYVTLFTLRAVGIDDRDVRPEDSLCEVAPRPVLFVDGTADPAARDADRYEARACGPARVVLLPGAAHGDYGGAAEAPFSAVVARFLGETIGR